MSVTVDIPYSDIKDVTNEIEGLVRRIFVNRRYPIAETFIDYCTPFVPVKSGALRSSATIVDNGYSVQWSAINPKSGYDYAQIQYEIPFNHPRGGTDHWDQEMMWYEGENFVTAVAEILRK